MTQESDSMDADNPKTAVRDQAIVQLVREVEYRRPLKEFRFVRTAPTLPKEITWHKGLMVEDGEDAVEIEEVYLRADGSVRIYIKRSVYGDFDRDERQRWLDAGWSIEFEHPKEIS